ncbi:hypothetical protein EBR57_09685 [bacterium]|nr:hypothetical protein [bacterium]
MKFDYTPKPFYTSVAYIFSDDGSTCDVVTTNKSSQPFKFDQSHILTPFTNVIFRNYKLNHTNNPNVIFGGGAQYSYLESSKSWLASWGYQSPVMSFGSDFTRAYSPITGDWYISEQTRSVIQDLYPPKFFESYKGNAWYKDPYTFGKNGFDDKNTNPTPYFKCVPYQRSGSGTLQSLETQLAVGFWYGKKL